MTDIYLLPYHSMPGRNLKGSSGQFRVVEEAILSREFPYDNGDDPSFFVARQGGPLTWGVCREDVRNGIKLGSIAVFFAFDHPRETETDYRLSAIGTVSDKIDRRMVFEDERFKDHLPLYVNLLIRPRAGGGWEHAEQDRAKGHKDWLWRIAIHERNKKVFKERTRPLQASNGFADGDIDLAKNYVVFSSDPSETHISVDPPLVAVAPKGGHEEWLESESELQRLTVTLAGQTKRNLAECKCGRHPKGRDFLRTINPSERNLHPRLRFRLPPADAIAWRQSLIKALADR